MSQLEDRGVISRLQGWLGADLYSARLDSEYLVEYRRIVRAACGDLPDEMNPVGRLDAQPVLWELFSGVADGFVRRWLQAHRRSTGGRYSTWSAESPHSRIADLSPSRMAPSVSVNTASTVELAAVPGIGPKSAARIVAHRRVKGTFKSLDELAQVSNFDKQNRDKAAPYLTVESPQLALGLTNSELLETDGPVGFPAYVRLVAATGLRLQRNNERRPSGPMTAPALALHELRKVADEAAAHPCWVPLRRADVPELQVAYEGRLRVETIETQPSAQPQRLNGVSMIRNSLYLEFALSLIANAQRRIWGQMFFFTSAAGTPGAKLLAALKDAHDRGVDVRLILDTDLDEDRHQASRINAASVAAMQAAGIPFRLDWPGITSHTKMMLVDDDQVLVGSHNWTASAMYQLDETSVYLESEDVVASEAALFGHLWAAYDPDEATRTIHLSLLLYPTPAERHRLATAGLVDSRTLLSGLANQAAIGRQARALKINEKRLAELWHLASLMQALEFPEPTAYALVRAGVDTPSKFRRTGSERIAELLKALPPFEGSYRFRPIRYDIVEVAHAGK